MYNSSRDAKQDDENLTMIDQSLLYGNNDEPTSTSVVRHLQQANHSTCKKNGRYQGEYVFVEGDRYGAAREIEQILNFYRQDLKQEANTQLDCNRQLITRLIDFLRPVFSTNETKMNDLDALYEDISDSQDIRYINQSEKLEQLNKEIVHLRKVIITPSNEPNRTNPMTKAYQINSMVHYDQWSEMEEEAKKLHQLVETQRNRINELTQLIFSEDEPSNNDRQPSTTHSTRPSSGTKSTLDKQSTDPAPKLPVLSRVPSYDIESCPICRHKFPRSSTEIEVAEHMENCLPSTTSPSTRIEQHPCPYCQQQYSGNDKAYLQHVTDCLNQQANRF